ncbi:MAG: HAMP domain-containing protein [Oscillospiraceae bacterium]|nr:HAMP domain-containing protein [Oscillospiraceae bacterium]
MKSVYFKNFVMTAMLVIISFFLLGTSIVILGRSFALNQKRESIALNATEVSKAASAFCEQNGDLTDWYLRLIISSLAKSTENDIFITDVQGLIVSSSDMDVISPYIGKQISSNIMEVLYKNGKYQKLTTLDNFYNERPYYVVALPIVIGANNALVGYIFVGSDCTAIVDAWGTASTVFITTATVVMLLAIILSYYTSKRQSGPLLEMAAAARRFAHGDFSARVADEGREDEIGELTESFNMMAESLEKSEQLRSEFIANLSHELKTPMTTISGFADGILDGTIPKDEQDRYLATISSETKRLSRLVRQMLQMSRIQSVDTPALLSRSFNLSEVIMRTLLTFEGKITQNGLDVDAQLPEESIAVRGDEDSITQVVYNLLDNAIKFSETGTAIGISLWKQGGKAFVSIKNHGETISPQELPFIFDRFHKTDKSRSLDRDGVGLGLSIVKTILNNHNEDVSVTSRDGITEFIFTVRLKNI